MVRAMAPAVSFPGSTSLRTTTTIVDHVRYIRLWRPPNINKNPNEYVTTYFEVGTPMTPQFLQEFIGRAAR
jgi:hypothetical protein